MTNKNLLSRIAVLTGLTLGAFALSALATGTWTAPTQTAPGGNVDAPINVGATTQTKLGGLNLNYGVPGSAYGLNVWGITQLFGNLVVGTTSVPAHIQMVDGNQGAGKVLTSDANGIGSWADASSTGSSGTNVGSGVTIVGPFSTTSASNGYTQQSSFYLTGTTNVIVSAVVNVGIPNSVSSVIHLYVDGNEIDSATISDAAISGGSTQSVATLLGKLSLGAGMHSLVVKFPSPGYMLNKVKFMLYETTGSLNPTYPAISSSCSYVPGTGWSSLGSFNSTGFHRWDLGYNGPNSSGGDGINYTYSWSGDEIPSQLMAGTPDTENNYYGITVTYKTPGTKHVYMTVTSGGQSQTFTCSGDVTITS